MPTKRKARLTAKTADKNVLYESSVQDVDSDIRFIDRVYKRERSKLPKSLREDFCGTGWLCSQWVKKDKERTAVGLDLDPKPMDWGYKNHIEKLPAAAQTRVSLKKGNVLVGHSEKVDVAVGFNFSYCCFLRRKELLQYFKTAHKTLERDGLFFIDIHGGTEVFEEMEETTKHKDFTYVWDQQPYDAINGFAKRHIHFRFRDGTQLEPAFSYDWRLWNLPEVKDILLEAGFSRVDVYWEGTDEDGDGNGVFRKKAAAENELSWIAYVVAVP